MKSSTENSGHRRKRKSWLGIVIRAGIGLSLAALLVFLTLQQTGADLLGTLRNAPRGALAGVLFFFGAGLFLSMFRWAILLRTQNIHLPFRDVARLTMIGHFFNLVVPGAVGGDLIKMAYAARRTPGKRTEAVFTVVLDRFLGLFGLFILAAMMVLTSLPFLLGLEGRFRTLQIAAFVVGMGSIAGIVGAIAIELRQRLLSHPWIAGVVDVGKRVLPGRMVETIERLSESLELIRQNRVQVGTALLLALLVHTSLALSLFTAGRAVGEAQLTFPDYLLTTQVANAIAAIPITPAGVGTRDAVIAMFFNAMGTPAAKAGVIPVLLTLALVGWGLAGAVVFIASPAARHSTEALD